MKPGVPWSVKGIEPEVRAAAKTAARRAGMTLGEWLNSVILDQNEHIIDSPLVQNPYLKEKFLSAAPQDPVPSRPGTALRDDSTLRLQDIAQQLSDLAQKERQSAAIPPYEPVRGRHDGDEAIARALERVDDNERQTVEAFTAVNERLSILGQQIAMLSRAHPLERPEDVPGYTALESAIRNVVEHIEVSEKRTRESLKATQDRLSDLAEQSVLAGLDTRVAELSNRLERAESTIEAGIPEAVRREFAQIAERIENVKAVAEQMAKQAQGAATGIARSELREIETRVLAMLQETQAAAAAQASAGPDIGQLRFEMDRRLGDLGRRLDQVASQAGGAGQVSDIEDRLAELGQRVEEAMTQRGDPPAIALLERNIAAVGERVGRTEEQLRHIETMEHAIRRLYDSLEQSRDATTQAAEAAASRTVERMFASGTPGGPSPELRALEDGLRALRESAAGAERRNQETLAAVHETLSQIVEKIAELEAAPAAAGTSSHAAAARSSAAEPARAVEPQPGVSREVAPHRPEAPSAAGGPSLSDGDDFIAAARRAAQAAATRPSALRAELGVIAAPAEEEAGPSFLRQFRQPANADMPGMNGHDATRDAGANSSRRRRLLLAGIVLLAAVSAFAFNILVSKPVPPIPAGTIEAPVPQTQGGTQDQPGAVPERQGLIDLRADPVVTGSLAAGVDAVPARLPPPETGTQALRTAAAQGDAAAQFIVASRFLDGDGVAQDAANAAFWYEQAAASGLAPAQYRLATLLERGKGVAQDAAAALSWYQRAARQGNVKAMHNAAVLSVSGEAGIVDHVAAFSLFASAAERGLRDSQFNLAVLHERGLGTGPDKAEAYVWYRLAAQQGDSHAAERAAALAQSLTAAERSRLDARLAVWVPQPSDDSANVVAIVEPDWTEPATSVLLSGAAVPAALQASADDLVTEAQQLLAELGFNVGTPDGKLGSRTAAALRQFQRQSGLEVTGEITPEVLEAMRARAG